MISTYIVDLMTIRSALSYFRLEAMFTVESRGVDT
jgi:hypothetical protein